MIAASRLTSSLSKLSNFLSSFFFNDTATTEIYTLSLHDALPISSQQRGQRQHVIPVVLEDPGQGRGAPLRSEEHTSELQSHHDLVCRLLLEKKNRLRPSAST